MALSAAATYLDNQRPSGVDLVILDFPVAASTTIYEGAYVCFSGGYVSPWTGTGQRLGLARQTVDNLTGSAGDLDCKVCTGRMRFSNMDIAGTITAASSGSEIYCASDDLGGITVTAGTYESIGMITGNIDVTNQTADFDLLGLWGSMGGDFDGPVKINSTLTMGGAIQHSVAYTGKVIETGTYASTASQAVTLSAANARPATFIADDAGANIGDSVRNVLSRVMLTVDQSGGSIRSLMGQLKLATGVDVTTGIYTPVQGYIEMAGTHSCKTGATLSCFSASAEITTALTVDSGGEFAGMHIETTGAGTITNNGTCTGLLIDMASGAAKWPEGIFIDGASVIMGGRVGKFASGGATTSAVPFATAQNIYSDGQLSTFEFHGSSASDLTSAYCAKVIRARHVVNVGTGNLAHETYGVMGQLVVKDTTLQHLHSGLIGTLEGQGTNVFNGSYFYGAAAVMARVGGASTITATKDVAGFLAFLNGADVASGLSVAYGVGDQGTAPWGAAFGVERATNLFDLPVAGTAPVAAGGTIGTHGTSTVKIAILVNNVTHYLLASTVPTFT